MQRLVPKKDPCIYGKCMANAVGQYGKCKYIYNHPMDHMGVSKNKGTPKWMIYNGKRYLNGWFGGTTIFGNPHMGIQKKTWVDDTSK